MREFWAVPEDQERLNATTPDEAFAEYAEDMGINDLPETMTAHQFKPRKVSAPDADVFLEGVLETMDEEYGDMDGDPFTPTEAMKSAAKTFCEVMEKEYEAWACELTGETVTVKTVTWIREHQGKVAAQT